MKGGKILQEKLYVFLVRSKHRTRAMRILLLFGDFPRQNSGTFHCNCFINKCIHSTVSKFPLIYASSLSEDRNLVTIVEHLFSYHTNTKPKNPNPYICTGLSHD